MAVLASAVAIALAAGSAQAQRFPDDSFGGFTGGGRALGGNFLRIERITAAGNGCPRLNSSTTLLDQRGGTARLQIQFNRDADRRFQVDGPGSISRSCTVRIRMFNDSGQPLDVALDRAAQAVQFVNGANSGQLLVRSQFALAESVSGVRSVQLQNTPNARSSNLQLDGLGLRASFSPRRLDLAATVQLQLQGRNNGALRLDTLTLELLLQPGRATNGGGNGFNGGNGLNDPFLRSSGAPALE